MSTQPFTGVEITPRRRFYLYLDRLLMKQEAIADAELSIFARIARNLRHSFLEDAPFPIAVSVADGRYTLQVNLKRFNDASYEDFKVLIKHEVLHIIMHDIPRMIRMSRMYPEDERPMRFRHILNIAADLAVNSQIVKGDGHIRNMADNFGPMMPDRYDFPYDLSSEMYVDLLENLFDEALSSVAMKMRQLIEELRQQGQQQQQGSQGDEQEEGEEEGEGEGEGEGEEGDDSDGEGKGEGEEGDDGDEEGKGGGEGEGDPLGDGEGLPEQIRELLELGNKHSKNNHHPWSDFLKELTTAEAEVIDQALQQMGKSLVIDAATEHKKMHGTLPAHYQMMLDALFQEWVTPWQQLLKQFVRARLKAKSKMTMTRPHRRRYLFRRNQTGRMVDRVVPKFPGKKTSRKYSVLWVTDTSGSMSNDDIMEGLSELRGMLRTIPALTVFCAQADTKISHLIQLDQETDLKQYVRNIGRTSCGGTHFEDGMVLAKATWMKKDYPDLEPEFLQIAARMPPVDVLIYATDGYAPAPRPSVRPPGTVLWLLSKHGKTKEQWERELHYGLVISQRN